LETANNWIIFKHPLGPEKAATPTPPIPKGAQRILYTKGKAGRERGWWRTGTDKLASYGPHPAFLWTEEGVEHRCSMNKTLRTRAHLKVSKLQLPPHKNYTSEFLNREDNSRDLLGKHWQDKTVLDRSKRRLLQSIGHQFPYALSFSSSGIFETVMSADSVNASTRR